MGMGTTFVGARRPVEKCASDENGCTVEMRDVRDGDVRRYVMRSTYLM